MKKFALGTFAMLAITAGTMSSAFADVIRQDGATTGQPVAAESNTGSAQGQAHRSATGTNSKITHDGTVPIIVPN